MVHVWFLVEQWVKNLMPVSKDGLVGYQWKERPLGLASFICPSTGERQGQKAEWGGGVGDWGSGYGGPLG